jgi:hypothetical protein
MIELFMDKFKCPLCKAIHPAREWNKTTKISNHGMDVVKIYDPEKNQAYFTCPSCNHESKGIEIQKI